MGAGASAANHSRLRKALILRAYNLRGKDQTLEDQFFKYSIKKGGSRMISVRDVREALSMNTAHMDDLFRTCLGVDTTDISFDCFIEFLETGKANFNVAANPRFSQNSAVDFDALNKPPRRTAGPGGQRPVGVGMPPTPPRGSVSAEPSVEHPDDDDGGSGLSARSMYAGVFDSLGFRRSHAKRGWATSSRTVVREDNSAVQALVRLHAGHGEMRAPPGKPLWRKREVVRSERTVHYTTVDASGLLQELVEKECTETEVLHMECRETGEFAHRETTRYEQQETFNDEIVAEEKGTEEYVHLKSQDDEIEFMESNMPRRGRPQEPPADYDVHEAPEEGGGAEGHTWHADLPKGSPEECGPPEDRQDYGDWGSTSHFPPHVHVHPPFDDQAPGNMFGATFDGVLGTPEPPPGYAATSPAADCPQQPLPDAEPALGLPPYSQLHVYPESKGVKDNDAEHKRRRKWSPPPSGPRTNFDQTAGGTTPWYDNDSDVEDTTDNADESGTSAPISSAGGDHHGGIDRDFLFAPAKSVDQDSISAAVAGAGSTHADILLQRYDSFKLD